MTLHRIDSSACNEPAVRPAQRRRAHACRLRPASPAVCVILSGRFGNRAGWPSAFSSTSCLVAMTKRSIMLNGLDPLHWLASVLERLPTCPNSQIDSLVPFPDST